MTRVEQRIKSLNNDIEKLENMRNILISTTNIYATSYSDILNSIAESEKELKHTIKVLSE